MIKPTPSNAELIAAYLDAVMRKEPSVVERFFDPDVEYMVNGTPSPDPAGVLPPISQIAMLRSLAVDQQMLAKYPEYHVRQFLTAFSIPSYFPFPSAP